MYAFTYEAPTSTAAAAAQAAAGARPIAGGQSLLPSLRLRLADPGQLVDLGRIPELAGGTLGGSLANNDPAACYPSAALALGATIVTNQREIAADDFFVGMYTTALEEGELITAVRFPIPRKASYQKFRQGASRFALVGVFVAQTASGVRVAVTGAASSVFRQSALEAALNKSFTAASAAAVKVDASDLGSDIHASPVYRAQLISVLTQRAVKQMLG